MANIKSAEKKNRQRAKHQARNSAQKSAMRTAVKKLRAAIVSKETEKVPALLKNATKLVSRLGGKGVIKKRSSSRMVSRLTVAANAAKK
jgi:small subunit ribosomal protein S20